MGKDQILGSPSAGEVLLDTFLPQDSVAIRGCSREMVKLISDRGYLPESPDSKSLSWQRRLAPGNQKLYYFLPLLKRIEPIKPGTLDLFARNASRTGGPTTPQDFQRDTNHLVLFEAAVSYGSIQAVEDGFRTMTDLKLDSDELYSLANKHIPKEFKVYQDVLFNLCHASPLDAIPQVNLRTNKNIRAARDKYTVEQLREFLVQALNLDWFILPFNQKILEHKFYAGREIHEDLMVVTREPLPLSALSAECVKVSLSPKMRLDKVPTNSLIPAYKEV